MAEQRLPQGEAAQVPATGAPPRPNKVLIDESLGSPPRRADFSGEGLSGAQVFANLCVDENLSALFLAAGNYSITHELAQAGIPAYGGRTEGGMCCAADGFVRASGEIAAASGTEGPGLMHMMMGIGSAHFSNTALLVLASNKSLAAEDSQRGIQWMNQQNATEGLRKYGKRITDPSRIYEYGAYAFRNLKSGVPGLVHLDFPEEVARARHAEPSKLVGYADHKRYRTESRAVPDPKDVRAAIDMIAKAERPVLVAGHGVIWRKAWEPLLRAAEANDLPVISTGPVRGAVPDDHRLSANMANAALRNADLVIIVGQYLMPTPSEWTFAPNVPTIRVHPTAEDLGRNWPLDLGLMGDELAFLEALADGLPLRRRDGWLGEIAAATQDTNARLDRYYKLGLDYSYRMDALHPAVICRELANFLYRGDIDPRQSVTLYDGAVIGAYAGLHLRAFRPAQEIVSMYQFGAMGVAFPQAVGAAAAVQRGVGMQAGYAGAPVFVVSGDGCTSYGLFELDTAMKYKLPVINLVSNNNAWGTFPTATGPASPIAPGATPRATHLHLFQDNLRYDRVAEGLGARGAHVRTPEELRTALKVAYEAAVREGASTVINCQSHRDLQLESVFPMGGAPAFPPAPGIGAGTH